MRKAFLFLLVVVMLFSLLGCATNTTNGDKGDEAVDFKIGIVTGTVSQGEEEFRAAQDLVAEYGMK